VRYDEKKRSEFKANHSGDEIFDMRGRSMLFRSRDSKSACNAGAIKRARSDRVPVQIYTADSSYECKSVKDNCRRL